MNVYLIAGGISILVIFIGFLVIIAVRTRTEADEKINRLNYPRNFKRIRRFGPRRKNVKLRKGIGVGRGAATGAGISYGFIVGLVLGLAIENVGMGIAIGIVAGIALGVVGEKNNENLAEDPKSGKYARLSCLLIFILLALGVLAVYLLYR